MNEIKIIKYTGRFAENKDVAKKIRVEGILPMLESSKDVALDFEGIASTTQSFIHALISDIIRKKGIDVLDHLFFKNCNEVVQKLINIVVDYMQDRIDTSSSEENRDKNNPNNPKPL